jgi:site-specific recombinase XerD
LRAAGHHALATLTPDTLRRYLLSLEEKGHNPGGLHATYRAIKAFLFWYEDEVEPEGWRNPIRKVKAQHVPQEPLDAVPVDHISALIRTCNAKRFTDLRDKAILLGLLDTGLRMSEFLNLNLEDINAVTGAILIRSGKGRKPRTVYIGKTARKAFGAYLRSRPDECDMLWVSTRKEKLGKSGLRTISIRRAEKAGILAPSPHDFRRAFGIEMWWSGTDILTISKLMGHTSLAVISRYLKQDDQDLENAFRKASPVDRNL